MDVLRGFKALTSRFLLTNISYPVDLCPARGPFVSSQFSSFLSTDAWYPAGTIHFVVLYPWATNVWYSDMATRTRSVWPFFTLTNKVCYQTRAGLLARVTLVGNLTDKLLALIWILLVPYLLDSLPTFRIQRWTFCSRARGWGTLRVQRFDRHWMLGLIQNDQWWIGYQPARELVTNRLNWGSKRLLERNDWRSWGKESVLLVITYLNHKVQHSHNI